ncbi:hypothetical protein NE237_024138 [Protea cynaroides]|uniref:Uncharacterized protein n=1 Tax=Protea cynaroides TaxID=273540 RepID=A0A9Q0HE38_9MAGN|nr:hypothetical protein NE237_024138 [Protea cynaroides]
MAQAEPLKKLKKRPHKFSLDTTLAKATQVYAKALTPVHRVLDFLGKGSTSSGVEAILALPESTRLVLVRPPRPEEGEYLSMGDNLSEIRWIPLMGPLPKKKAGREKAYQLDWAITEDDTTMGDTRVAEELMRGCCASTGPRDGPWPFSTEFDSGCRHVSIRERLKKSLDDEKVIRGILRSIAELPSFQYRVETLKEYVDERVPGIDYSEADFLKPVKISKEPYDEDDQEIYRQLEQVFDGEVLPASPYMSEVDSQGGSPSTPLVIGLPITPRDCIGLSPDRRASGSGSGLDGGH